MGFPDRQTPGFKSPAGAKKQALKMEYYNNILCVEAGWLVDNGIMAIHQYKYLSKSKQINIVRRACKNTPALVAYDSIPRRFKPAIKEALGCDPDRKSVV